MDGEIMKCFGLGYALDSYLFGVIIVLLEVIS